MSYAIKKLTQELQKLTAESKSNSGQFGCGRAVNLKEGFTISRDSFSKDVEEFLDKKREYAKKARLVNVGQY